MPGFSFLRAVVLWLSFAATTVFFALIVLVMIPFAPLFDKEKHSMHYVAIIWARVVLILNPWWRFKIVGREHLLPSDQPVVYVSNHTSQSDILAIFALGVRFRWLTKASVFKIPLFGWAVKAIGNVGVHRGDKSSHTKCMEESKGHLLRRTSMMFFPEGTRSRDGVMQAFKSGAFRLACDARVPVIPISLVGTETLLPKGSFRPNVTDVRIIVHPAISSLNKAPDELMDEAQRIVSSGLPESQRNVRSRP